MAVLLLFINVMHTGAFFSRKSKYGNIRAKAKNRCVSLYKIIQVEVISEFVCKSPTFIVQVKQRNMISFDTSNMILVFSLLNSQLARFSLLSSIF